MTTITPLLATLIPRAPPDLSPVDKSIATESMFITRPCIGEYDPTDQYRVATSFLEDARACQTTLSCPPHPNVMTYLGAEISADGYLMGLCFELKEHWKTLLQVLSCYDEDYCDQHRAWIHVEPEACRSIMKQIKEGLEHLHTLDLFDNGLCPSTIMLDLSQENVFPRCMVAMFKACRPAGVSIRSLPRPVGWYDPSVLNPVSGRQNETYSFCYLTEWMLWRHPKNPNNISQRPTAFRALGDTTAQCFDEASWRSAGNREYMVCEIPPRLETENAG